MNCIDKARMLRQGYIENLIRQGFPSDEATFLTGIFVVDPDLLPYCIRDLGRMTSDLYLEYREKFPEAAKEIDETKGFHNLTRHWGRASTIVENVRIDPNCREIIQGLIYFSEFDDQWHID